MSGYKLIVLNFTWAALALTSYFIGTNRRSDAVQAGKNGEETRIVEPVTALGSQGGPGSPTGGFEAVPPDEVAIETPGLSDVEAAIAFQEAAQARRQQQMADYFASTVSPQNARSMLEEFKRTPRNAMTDRTFLAFLKAWGNVAGPEAISIALDSIPTADADSRWATQSSLENIMAGWASADPKAAMEFTNRLRDGNPTNRDLNFATAMQLGILQELQRSNLDGAIEYSQQFYLDTLESWRANRVAKKIYLQGLEEVAATVWERQGQTGMDAWISEIDGETSGSREFRLELTSKLLEPMRAESPERAAAWVAANAYSGLIKGSDIVSASKVFADTPEGQIEWIAALPGDANRSAMYGSYSGWLREDFNAAGEWLVRQPLDRPMYDGVIARYANETATDDPSAARLWANEITGERLRRWTLKRIDEALRVIE